MKKVLLVIIDALASRVIEPAMQAGRLPNLRAVADAGWMRMDSTAIFPSITPAATAALITGGFTCETGISGAYYYDTEQDCIHYFGDDTWAILREGFGTYLDDFLVSLNRDQLRAETLFQSVERAGGRAASLNYLWFRGDHPHDVRIPLLMKLWPGSPRPDALLGPQILALGDFVTGEIELTGQKLKAPGGPSHRFGINDDATADLLLQMARGGPMPNFTVAYFPDNDYDSHDYGPTEAVATVEKVDAALGELFDVWGGLNGFLQEVAIVITGDHSQSDLPLSEEEASIVLDEVLSDFSIVPAGKNWSDGDELMICPNMRAAQIYLRRGYWPRRREIVEKLLGEERVDQVMWCDETADGRCTRYTVATRDRGTLEFKPAAEGEPASSDVYGNAWNWSGDLRVVDARIDEQGILRFGDYPNALERVATSFDDRVSGDLWVTSRLKYEFRLTDTGTHRYGAHGSLHAHDSTSPLIVAGAPSELRITKSPRSVDVTPLCCGILGLQPRRPIGAPHVNPRDDNR